MKERKKETKKQRNNKYKIHQETEKLGKREIKKNKEKI